MCNKGVYKEHSSIGWPVGWLRAVAEGGNGRYKGELRKPVSAGIREKELR